MKTAGNDKVWTGNIFSNIYLNLFLWVKVVRPNSDGVYV